MRGCPKRESQKEGGKRERRKARRRKDTLRNQRPPEKGGHSAAIPRAQESKKEGAGDMDAGPKMDGIGERKGRSVVSGSEERTLRLKGGPTKNKEGDAIRRKKATLCKRTGEVVKKRRGPKKITAPFLSLEVFAIQKRSKPDVGRKKGLRFKGSHLEERPFFR